MSIRRAYADWAATYDGDRNRTRDLDRTVTERALSQERPATVLELGCGTGKNTLLLSAVARRVLALDFSDGMLRQARGKVQSGSVLFAVADLTQPWPCPAGSANLLICNLVLEHIADLGPIFAEAARVLVPGGQFFVSELHPFRQYSGKQANFMRAGERVSIPPYVHHISDFTAAARSAGFALVELREWWHAEDQGAPPLVVTFMFGKLLIEKAPCRR